MSEGKPRVDFDHFSPEYARNWREIDRGLRENTPVAWTEAHGGFWVLTKYEDCKRAASDWQFFSSENDVSGHGNGGKGVLIPPSPFQFALSESDPPQSTELRKLYTPRFVQKSIERQRAVAEQHAKEALDRVAHTGHIDFVHEIAMEVPARTVLKLVGVPAEDWKLYAVSAHDMTRMPSSDPLYPHKEIEDITARLFALVAARRREPRDDLVSHLVHGVVLGQPMSDEMAVGVVSAAVFAGFDTVTATTLSMLLLLDERPDIKQRLIDEPRKFVNAVDETLRLFPPGHTLARTVVQDVEIRGQALRKGDRVMMLWSAANRDPDKFENAEVFDIDRFNAGQHLSFGFGGHRCLGSLLGKLEIEVTIHAILGRIGDYKIERDKIERYPMIGSIDGYVHMPATFTPERAMVEA